MSFYDGRRKLESFFFLTENINQQRFKISVSIQQIWSIIDMPFRNSIAQLPVDNIWRLSMWIWIDIILYLPLPAIKSENRRW